MELSVALLILLAAVPNEGGSSKHAAEAYARYTGIDRQLDRFQKDTFSEETRLYAGKAVVLTQTLIEKRITFRWTF